MSTTTPTDGWAFADRWDPHVARSWFDRSETPHREDRGAFERAKEVHYPSADDGCSARYDPDAGVVFVVTPSGYVRTCIALSDHESWERAYVQEQVTAHE